MNHFLKSVNQIYSRWHFGRMHNENFCHNWLLTIFIISCFKGLPSQGALSKVDESMANFILFYRIAGVCTIVTREILVFSYIQTCHPKTYTTIYLLLEKDGCIENCIFFLEKSVPMDQMLKILFLMFIQMIVNGNNFNKSNHIKYIQYITVAFKFPEFSLLVTLIH